MSTVEYQQRYNPKSVMRDNKNMPGFVSHSNGERRYYRQEGKVEQPSTFNLFLKTLGVPLFSGGFVGVVLMIIQRKVLQP